MCRRGKRAWRRTTLNETSSGLAELSTSVLTSEAERLDADAQAREDGLRIVEFDPARGEIGGCRPLTDLIDVGA